MQFAFPTVKNKEYICETRGTSESRRFVREDVKSFVSYNLKGDPPKNQ